MWNTEYYWRSVYRGITTLMCIDYCPFSQKLGEHPVTVTCPTGGHQVIIEKGELSGAIHNYNYYVAI